MKAELIAEAALEAMIREQVSLIKAQYACWSDPEALCAKLDIHVAYGSLGLGREGAAFAEAIQLDRTVGAPARRQFTFYHEIVHHLLRRNDELYSILNDQYESETLFNAICERLCNVGAAEFLLSREQVRAAYEERGFSIALVEELSQPGRISRVATCAQLAFCAPHQCIALVCRTVSIERSDSGVLLNADVRDENQPALVIACVFRSATTRYSCATGTQLSSTHLLAQMVDTPHGERVKAKALIPFRSEKRWTVDCECVRLGEQVFAFFHLEEPPVSSERQLSFW